MHSARQRLVKLSFNSRKFDILVVGMGNKMGAIEKLVALICCYILKWYRAQQIGLYRMTAQVIATKSKARNENSDYMIIKKMFVSRKRATAIIASLQLWYDIMKIRRIFSHLIIKMVKFLRDHFLRLNRIIVSRYEPKQTRFRLRPTFMAK